MKILSSKELRALEQLFQLKQSSLLKVLKQYLQTKYETVIATDDYIVAVGNIPIGLVAHLDTVFAHPPKDIYYDRVKNVLWSPDGLGADDRAGVYAIIQVVKSGLRPTVIFTADEELGCLGATQMVSDIPEPPVPLKYIIELDRQGANDCVFYSCANYDFNDYVEAFGFITDYGSFSDISIICPYWDVAGVNLSIGYCREHSVSEILNIGQMHNTIEKVKAMLNDAANAQSYEYIEELKYNRWFKTSDIYSFDWDPSCGLSKETWSSLIEPRNQCVNCEISDYEYNLFPTKGENGELIFFCADCVGKRDDVHWCMTCGEPFIDKSKDQNQICHCNDCEVRIKC